jgi:tetratricopeptide (TPR) repeat protein
MAGTKCFTKAVLLLTSLTCFSITPALADSTVRIWEEPLVIPTYEVGEPDPNPRFYAGRTYQGAQGRVYPYPMLDVLTDSRKDKTYKAVYLENEYVKICVLPEIGGRILAALDKTNNYDFLYRQHVIKPALIGMLGAWISGGIEWCIPHHHRATTFMPVDYTLQENPDGSKTVWVGEIELRHRMKWLVGLTIFPEKSYMEATIKIINRTPFVNSILCWANVAVHANENYQVIFPPSTEYATYHGKNQFARWPISYEFYSGADYTRGVDLSWWKNHPSPMSFFAWNYTDDFFAGYDHGKEAGTIYVSNHHIAPGKKLWEWGPGPRGQMWDKILSETDGPYIEIMAGAYSDNQPDYSWIQPYEVKIIKEYWYPIRQIESVKNANLKAAVNLELTQANTAKIGFNTTSAYKNALVLLEADEQVVFKQRINIGPDRPFLKEIALAAGVREKDLRVSLLSSTNEKLIAYTPVEKEGAPMPKPVEPPPAPEDIKTIEELYLTGLRLDQFHSAALEPYPYYEEALKRDPYDSRVNTELGILYCKRGMFKEAEEKFNRAIKRLTKNYTSPKSGQAHYYLGLALKFQGKYDAAYDALYKATWSSGLHTAGYYHLAEIDCTRGDFDKALEHIDRSIATNAWNTKALNLKAAVLRRLKRFEEASQLASKTLAFDPLDFWAGYELYLAKDAAGLKKEATKALNTLKVKSRGEVQSYLETAVDYGNCGLWDEAIECLRLLADSKGKNECRHAMVYYYLGYFYEKKGNAEKASEYYRTASEMPPDYCFPFRLETIDVLNCAMNNNPSDALAPYYLGNLLYDNQPERAIKEWEKSQALDDSFATVHRNLGLVYARTENNIPKAIAGLEKAVACDKKDPRVYYELDLLYEAGGVLPQKRLKLLEENHRTIIKRDDALSREITLCVQLQQYDRALELLAGRHFHTWEGGGEIHNVYVDAHLLRGQKNLKDKRYQEALKDFEAAFEYPENLEVGRPKRDRRTCQTYFFIGTAYEALDDTQKAKEYFEKSASIEVGQSEYGYYKGLALKKLGEEAQAERIFDELIESAKPEPAETFFAKFGEKQAHNIRTANSHYIRGLGYLGKANQAKARAEFEEALKLNINHLWAGVYLSELK